MKKILLGIAIVLLVGSIVYCQEQSSSKEELVLLRNKIAELENTCTPQKGTPREEVERIFGKGELTYPDKTGRIPQDSPYCSYTLCKDGILFVRYENSRVINAYYLDPFASKGKPLGIEIPIEEQLQEAKHRLKQMEIIHASYLKRINRLNQPLQLTIKSDKQVYEVGETINIRVKFTNIGNGEIMILKEIYWGGDTFFSVYKIENGGRTPIPLTELEYSRPSIASIPKKDLQVLEPNESFDFDKEENVLRWVAGKMLRPGIYEIKVMYYIDYPAIKIHPHIWTGTLVSNTITIEVVGKKLSKETIIKIAKNIPYNLNEIESIYDEGNQLWNKEWSRRRSYFGNLPEAYPPLAGKNYQAIYFSPKKTKGLRAAGVWVFVDRDSGKIITFQEEAN